jgi:hypothetical protein
MLVELGHTKLNELKQSEYMDFYKELTNEKWVWRNSTRRYKAIQRTI